MYCLFTIFQKLHFSNFHFFKRPQEKYYHVTILHSESLKKCHKNFENQLTWLTNKKFMPENNFEYGFFHCKKCPGKKSKMVIFHLKCTKPKPNCIVCIAERQTLTGNYFPKICLIFNFKVFGLPPLHMQNAYSR